MKRGVVAIAAAAVALSGAARGAEPASAPSAVSHKHTRGVRVIQPEAEATSSGDKPAPVVGPAPVADVTKPAPVGPVGHSIMKVCDRPFARADLTYGAPGNFDRMLYDDLKAGRTVVVDLAEPFDQKAPPPAGLRPWLAEARSAGGAVTVSPYCSGGRGLLRGWVLDLVQHLTGSIYKPARGYDVTLFADESRRKITQVQFKPGAAAVARAN